MRKNINIISIIKYVFEFLHDCSNCRVVISSYYRLKEKYKLDFNLYDSGPLLYIYKGVKFYIYSDFPDELSDKFSEEIDEIFCQYKHFYYDIDESYSFRIDFKEKEK